MRLVDHEPRAILRAQLGDVSEWRDVSLHREHAVDDDEDAAAIFLRLLQPIFEQVEAVVAERPELRLGEEATVEDRGVVAGVDDDRVGGPEDRPEAPRLA